jgi:hypothetical protein
LAAVANVTKALLITRMFGSGQLPPWHKNHNNAHPDGASRMLCRTAIEHDYHHEPTMNAIASKKAARGPVEPRCLHRQSDRRAL